MNNVVQVENMGNLKGMKDIVSKDNGKGNKAANNQEYGGVVNKDGSITESPAGPVRNPKTDANAEITHTTTSTTRSTFHSHPSGYISETVNTGGVLGGSQTTTWSWTQGPSGVDVSGAKGTNYVFGMGSSKVYVYDKTGVIAVFPQKSIK